MCCHYGNPDCPDQTDRSHECVSRPRAPQHERIARLMQRLAIAKANCHAEIVLDSDEIETISDAFDIRCVANGMAVLYNMTFINPRFSERQAQIRAGMDICECCDGVLTPSNRAVHGAGKCWPTPASFRPSLAADERAEPWGAWSWGPDSENDE